MSSQPHQLTPSTFDSLHHWAQKIVTLLNEPLTAKSGPARDAPEADHLAYRLKHWPSLPPASSIADVYRTLSVMSHRCVSRDWILRTSKLKPAQVDLLLRRLIAQDAVEVIDVGRFAREAA